MPDATTIPRSGPRLDDLPATANEHFKLCWFGAILQVTVCAAKTLGGGAAVGREFPFLDEYAGQLDQRGLDLSDQAVTEQWWAAVESWERSARVHLPLRALRVEANLSWSAIGALITAGLLEDDPRFGAVFSRLQGNGVSSPTVGFLNACWQAEEHGPVRRLQELGLLQINVDKQPRHGWTTSVPVWVWEAISRTLEGYSGPGWNYESSDEIAHEGNNLILDAALERALQMLPALVTDDAVRCVILRGARGSGRRSVLRRLARNLGRGVLTLVPPLKPDDERWSLLGPMATLLGALPVVELDPGVGETARVPALVGCTGPLAIKLGRRGGLAGPGADRAVVLELDMPTPTRRRELWRHALPKATALLIEELAARHRLPAGRLVRLARSAGTAAAMAGRDVPTANDVAMAAQTVRREELDALTARLPAGAEWADLALPEDLFTDLHLLVSRCRHREDLAAEDHRFAPNAGVRALFTGPSGTGKTLAAQALGAVLGLDVYRVDLASVVNKYIGETEKNLDRVLALAEELDVLLLIDEGDALFTQRTAVQSANDRYANLETNFLLQRLESFAGIVIVTTNSAERIDSAFQRRMDAIVEFRAPDMTERMRLWELHLPADHCIDGATLTQLAAQCDITGGQIRNAALHARLLALDDGGIVNPERLLHAVRREYRRLGLAFPVRLPR